MPVYAVSATTVTTVPNGRMLGTIVTVSDDEKLVTVSMPNMLMEFAVTFALAPEPPPPPPPEPGPSVWDLINAEESEDDEV
jgi:hypothetical protein